MSKSGGISDTVFSRGGRGGATCEGNAGGMMVVIQKVRRLRGLLKVGGFQGMLGGEICGPSSCLPLELGVGEVGTKGSLSNIGGEESHGEGVI